MPTVKARTSPGVYAHRVWAVFYFRRFGRGIPRNANKEALIKSARTVGEKDPSKPQTIYLEVPKFEKERLL